MRRLKCKYRFVVGSSGERVNKEWEKREREECVPFLVGC